MNNPADLAAWSNFFVTAAGASAALVGLLFVAVSINLATILEHAWLPARAALVVIILVDALVCGLIGLVPGLPIRTSGVAFLVTGLVASALTAFAQTRARARTHYNASRGLVALQVVAVQIGPLAFALAGASLMWGFRGWALLGRTRHGVHVRRGDVRVVGAARRDPSLTAVRAVVGKDVGDQPGGGIVLISAFEIVPRRCPRTATSIMAAARTSTRTTNGASIRSTRRFRSTLRMPPALNA